MKPADRPQVRFNPLSFSRWFVCLLPFLMAVALSAGTTHLTLAGNRFLLNGRLENLYGIRVASALVSEENTHALLANLDDYKRHHVNAVTFFLQGSSGGYSDPFSSDGTAIEPAYVQRLQRVLAACDERGMVAIVGIFYQRVIKNLDGSRKLASRAAILQAVRTTTQLLQGHDNVIINIANEQNSSYYQDVSIFDFTDPASIVELCEVVKEVDPGRLVGAGGYHDASNVQLGRSPALDLLLFDTFEDDVVNNHDSGWHHDYFVNYGVTGKPLVNVEIFGAWTRECVSATGISGVFSPEQRQLHLREIDAACERPGLSVFFHSNAWCQGPSMGSPIRFDLAGSGTVEDPGIRWWFEYVKQRLDNLPKARGGIVRIEAESCTARGWERVEDGGSVALIDRSERNQGSLSTQVEFATPGSYYLFLRCRYTGEDPRQSNDCLVTLDDQKLYGGDDLSRPDGMRTHSPGFAWSFLPKGPGPHTPKQMRDDPVHFKVAHPGIYYLKVISRSMGFAVDQILLVHRDRLENPKDHMALEALVAGLPGPGCQ